MRTFGDLHPAVSFAFFLEVLLLSMIQMHPMLLWVSCILSLFSLWLLDGDRSIGWLKGAIGLAVLIAAGNGLLNPAGKTVLFTYFGGRAFTLESLTWGIHAAILFTAVILWFRCFHIVMTQEKIQFLFGRVIPSVSLLFSMVVRFVPEFLRQLRALTRARACLGLGTEQCGSKLEKFRRASMQLSAFLSLALEQAMITAASMRGRGYGLPGRKSYSLFHMDWWNGIVLVGVIMLGGISFWAVLAGGGTADYFPELRLATGRWLWLATGAEALLMALPALYGGVSRCLWQHRKRER